MQHSRKMHEQRIKGMKFYCIKCMNKASHAVVVCSTDDSNGIDAFHLYQKLLTASLSLFEKFEPYKAECIYGMIESYERHMRDTH